MIKPSNRSSLSFQKSTYNCNLFHKHTSKYKHESFCNNFGICYPLGSVWPHQKYQGGLLPDWPYQFQQDLEAVTPGLRRTDRAWLQWRPRTMWVDFFSTRLRMIFFPICLSQHNMIAVKSKINFIHLLKNDKMIEWSWILLNMIFSFF